MQDKGMANRCSWALMNPIVVTILLLLLLLPLLLLLLQYSYSDSEATASATFTTYGARNDSNGFLRH